MSRNMNAVPMSDKQNLYAADLYKRANTAGVLDQLSVDQRDILDRAKGKEPVTMNEARYLITGLLNVLADVPQVKVNRPKAQPGYYLDDNNDYIVVVENKAKTSTYAKRLVVSVGIDGKNHAKWVYAPGVGASLADRTPLTLKEAAAFGHLHGFCLVCAKQLTDPKSVAAGIGPVCATKFGGPRPKGMGRQAFEANKPRR